MEATHESHLREMQSSQAQLNQLKEMVDKSSSSSPELQRLKEVIKSASSDVFDKQMLIVPMLNVVLPQLGSPLNKCLLYENKNKQVPSAKSAQPQKSAHFFFIKSRLI